MGKCSDYLMAARSAVYLDSQLGARLAQSLADPWATLMEQAQVA